MDDPIPARMRMAAMIAMVGTTQGMESAGLP
jgi:hypothetical protein